MDAGWGLLEIVIFQKRGFVFNVWTSQLWNRWGHNSLQDNKKQCAVKCYCHLKSSRFANARNLWIYKFHPHLVQPLEVPTAGVSWCANIVHQVTWEAEVGRQEAWNKDFTDLDECKDQTNQRANQCCGKLQSNESLHAYPGDTSVENQTSTSLKNQHGIYCLGRRIKM